MAHMESVRARMGEHGLGTTKVRLRKIFDVRASGSSSAPRNPSTLPRVGGKILAVVHV